MKNLKVISKLVGRAVLGGVIGYGVGLMLSKIIYR
jgi:hypothetical protein